jgi:hypothetical protein
VVHRIDIVRKNKEASLHLQSLDQSMPEVRSLVFRQVLSVCVVLSQLHGEHGLVIGFRSEAPIDGHLIAVQLESENLHPTAVLERSVRLVHRHEADKDRGWRRIWGSWWSFSAERDEPSPRGPRGKGFERVFT